MFIKCLIFKLARSVQCIPYLSPTEPEISLKFTSILTLALSAVAVVIGSSVATPSVAHAQAAASPITANFGLTTDYRYRGISQSRVKPALSGGVDFADASGFYLGAWASTIKWVKDAGGGSNAEIDLYGGYKFKAGGVDLDVGALHYAYPSNGFNPKADTTEIYLAGTMGPVTLKYSHSLTNLFGFADSKGSGYLDLTGNLDLGDGYTASAHVGHQRVANNSLYSYTDYKISVSKEFFGVGFSAALIGTDTKEYFSPVNGKNLGKAGLVLSATKSF